MDETRKVATAMITAMVSFALGGVVGAIVTHECWMLWFSAFMLAAVLIVVIGEALRA